MPLNNWRVQSGLMIASLILASFAPPLFGKDLVVHAGTLLDGVGDAPRHQVSILIRDDRVLSVKPGFVTPPGVEVIDLSDATVMPGFIDCHVHIGALLPGATNATEYWMTHSDIDRALDEVVLVRQMLQQGFTSARDVGGGDDTVAVRKAIDAGMSPLQALYAATRSAADLLGVADLLGSIQAGRLADLVATHANPLEQPEAFRHVSFVMKGGVIYRHDDTESLPSQN